VAATGPADAEDTAVPVADPADASALTATFSRHCLFEFNLKEHFNQVVDKNHLVRLLSCDFTSLLARPSLVKEFLILF